MQGFTEKINAFLDGKKDEIFAAYKDIINLESYHSDLDALAKLAERLKTEFEAEGFQCRLIPVGPDNGAVLSGILGADRPGKPILFSGHMDTYTLQGNLVKILSVWKTARLTVPAYWI
jgi:glutamate carboxypeptidase